MDLAQAGDARRVAILPSRVARIFLKRTPAAMLRGSGREGPATGLTGRGYLGRLRSLGTVFDFEVHGLTLGQGAEAAALDRGEMDEYVLAAVVRSDEAKTFRFVKPLNST